MQRIPYNIKEKPKHWLSIDYLANNESLINIPLYACINSILLAFVAFARDEMFGIECTHEHQLIDVYGRSHPSIIQVCLKPTSC